jgi:hypothetical protein
MQLHRTELQPPKKEQLLQEEEKQWEKQQWRASGFVDNFALIRIL